MNWIQVEGTGYYDAFRCSNCNAVVVVADPCELPYYCKQCEAEAEE